MEFCRGNQQPTTKTLALKIRPRGKREGPQEGKKGITGIHSPAEPVRKIKKKGNSNRVFLIPGKRRNAG